MTGVNIVAAVRTAVAPRNGAFADIEASDLAAAVIRSLLNAGGVAASRIDRVILGNALYGGGNPARMAALSAGLDRQIPAMTIDTQCCAGLDAIIVAASHIASGQADVVIAGGVESYSRSPLRYRRPLGKGARAIPYDRPPFTPWPDNDPEMMEAAAVLAEVVQISRSQQELFAINSHKKTLASRQSDKRPEMAAVNNVSEDAFARRLTAATCARLPVLAGSPQSGLTAATIAVEADAAAAVLLVSSEFLQKNKNACVPIRFVAGRSAGGDPACPGLAPILPAKILLSDAGIKASDLAAMEIMEAFAVQAMVFTQALAVPDEIVNRGGGALSRGHPIGASGAILAVRLFHELQKERSGAKGLAAIAAAGGLGSAILLSRES